MNSEQLISEVLRKKESRNLEFLTAVKKEHIGKTLCAFLNDDGGQLLIGVDEKENVIGIRNALKAEKELHTYLISEIVPEAAITFSVETYKGKQLLLIKVWGGANKPYIFNGSIYYRRGADTVIASSREISDLINSRQQIETRWERKPVLEVTLKDLDTEEIKQTIKMSLDSGRSKANKQNPLDFLTYYGLYQNGRFNNSAVVLFGKEPTTLIPQSRIRICVFSDSKTGSEFLYDRLFEGNIFSNAAAIENFFEVNIGTSSHFKSKTWKREDKLNYPKDALREALLNAMIHRDYSNTSGTVQINFYPDRLEISSYGALPKDIKVEDLKMPHLSMPVNPDIAQICYLRGLIEKIGRGTLKMIEDCRVSGFRMPKWDINNNVVTVTFPGVAVVGKTKGIDDGKDDRVNDGLTNVVIDGVNDGVVDGVIDGVTNGVKDVLVKLVKVLDNKPGQIAGDLAKAIKKSKPTTERYIGILRKVNILEFKGAPKTGGYYINQNIINKIGRRR